MSERPQDQSKLPAAVSEPLPCALAVVDGDRRLLDANDFWESFADEHGIPSAGDPYVETLLDAGDRRTTDLAERVADLLDRPAPEAVELSEPPVRLVRFDHGDDPYVALLSDGTAVDSTAAELELKNRAMEEAPVGITISAPHLPDNPVVYANAAFERITGYPVEEVVGRNCRFLQGPGTDEATVRRMREAIDEDVPITVEVRNYRPDGEPFWNEVTIAPLRDDDGEVTHYVGFQRDVTDRKVTQRELETERDRQAVLNQIVRHDIRNDMAVVLGWGEQLREHVDEEGRQALERVLNAATHAKELTASVRDLAEVIGEDEPALAAVSVSAVLSDEVERVRSNFDYQSQSIEIAVGDLPADLEVRASSLLSSVFGNLLDNAVFHNDKETVRVDASVEEREDTAVVRIADNGPGIPDDRKEEVFGRGEKGLESPGSGLGLYLVDNLVETYGGSVWIEDNEPEGAVFCVELPKAGSDADPHDGPGER